MTFQSYRDPWPDEQAPLPPLDARKVDPILTASVWDAVIAAAQYLVLFFWCRGPRVKIPGRHQFFIEVVAGGDHIFENRPSPVCRHCGIEKAEAWRGDGSLCPMKGGPGYPEALARRRAMTTGDWLLDRLYSSHD